MMRSIDAREVWRREDEDFSPWLVKNLAFLDEILGTELELIRREQPVGSFFADILCVDRQSSDSLVVIENQLGPSDHDHLGKLVTYATGLHAPTAIWIATAFDQEHRNALAGLNRRTSNLLRCFGVKLELNPIDNSRCLPTFTLVVEPHVGTQQPTDEPPVTSHNEAQQPTDDRPPPPGGNSVESPYWSAFREFWNRNGSPLVPFEQTRDPNYFGFHIVQGFWFAAWRNNIEDQIAAKLCMHSTDNFDALEAQKRAIASEIREVDGILEWDPNPRYSPYPQVGFYKRGLPRRDRSDWQNQFEWLRATLEHLDRVFSPRIADIVSSVENSSENDIL